MAEEGGVVPKLPSMFLSITTFDDDDADDDEDDADMEDVEEMG